MIDQTRHNRYLLSFVAILLLISGYGCSSSDNQAQEAQVVPLTVRAQTASLRTFERRLTVQGTLETRHFANVASRADGNLDAIYVSEGDFVVADKTVLFQIDPSARENALVISRQELAVAQSSQAVAEANVITVEAEARKAGLDYERYKKLHAQDKVSDSDYERVETIYAQAKAGITIAKAQAELAQRQVKRAEAALSIAQKNLDDTRVVAPISGVISRRDAEPGEFITTGRVVLKIDDLELIEAAAFLPAEYYTDVTSEQTTFRLTVNRQSAGEHTITYKSPTLDPVLRTFEIKGRVTAPSDQRIDFLPGDMADLTAIFESKNALGVPSSAIVIRHNSTTVFIVDGDVAKMRKVETGLRTDGFTEIKAGLNEGESVVVEGQSLLSDAHPIVVQHD